MPDAAAPVSAVIVVAFNDVDEVAATVESLRAQTRPPAEILLVENAPEAGVGAALAERGLDLRVLQPGDNVGYGRGCNVAVAQATQPWILFVNPDARADRDCIERLLEAADDDVGLLGAQVLLPDGRRVNAGDNPVHLVGLSWSGRYLEPREDGPPRDVACVSGATTMARAEAFRAIGGFCPAFFLYVEDVDLAWRMWLSGWRVRFVPSAAVRHDYEFAKGAYKWFHLERNRLWMVLANYRLSTLVLLAPLLLVAELGIARLARRDGWWPEKVRAWRAIVGERRGLRAWRRTVQAGRRDGDRVVVEHLTGSLETPLVQAPAVARAEPVLQAYRRLLLRLLD